MIKKEIFGKCYQFACEADVEELLLETVSLYPDSDDKNPKVKVSIGSFPGDKIPLSTNPKIHKKYLNGMENSFGPLSVFWSWSDFGCLNVDVTIKKESNFIKMIRKLKSMEYPRDVEYFEQLLHELVLVPSVYFFADVAPVHAAAVTTGGKVCLLAGTGGVGKSSAMLAVRQFGRASFVSDDIAIISEEGSVYGNMAWPKIYGYNCLGNNLKNEILKGRGLIDSLHFNIKNRINFTGVRRKISPDRLYKKIVSGKNQPGYLYYLAREDVSEMKISELQLSEAVKMTTLVIESEYGVFHRHLQWEEYNALIIGKEPMLTMSDVMRRWDSVLTSAFSKYKRYKVSVPYNIVHSSYQLQIGDILNSI